MSTHPNGVYEVAGPPHLAALSLAARRQAEELARQAEHVNLPLDPAFATEFADAMIFPEE